MAEVAVTMSDADRIWDRKDEFAARAWEARKNWATLNDDMRAGIALIVFDQLVRLITDIDQWLPEAISLGEQLNVTISAQLPEVTKAARAHRVVVERAAISRAVAMQDLERWLRDDG